MYATIHRFRQWPDEESEEWGRALVPSVLEGADPEGSCVLGRLDGMDGAVFLLWRDAPDAAAAAGRTGGDARWLDAAAYRVVQVDPGTAAGKAPRFAQLTWLNGAGDADRADAALRSGRERIAPAVREVEGVVGTYVLRTDDHRIVVVTLVTGIEVPEAMRRAIFATELMPWEDRSQLIGPDRLDIDRVLFAQLPAEVGA